MQVDLDSVRARLLASAKQLSSTFVGRDEVVDAVLRAVVAGQNFLLVGDAGTAKTALVTCLYSHFADAKVFRTLLGSFTTPEKVFGPLDIEAFKSGVYRTVTKGMLPDADLGWLDEAMKASDGMKNELLGILNEREFQGARTPLLTCGGATNWPEVEGRTENVQALYDRWLIRVPIFDVEDPDQVARVLAASDRVNSYAPEQTVTIEELRAANAALADVKISDEVRGELARLKLSLGQKRSASGALAAGITTSLRRVGQLQQTLRASAWLDGRAQVELEDFGVLKWGFWNHRGELEAATAVIDSLDQEWLRKGIRFVDAARQLIRNGAGKNGPAALNEVTGAVRQEVQKVREIYDSAKLTKKGKQKLGATMKEFHEELVRFVDEKKLQRKGA